MDNFKDDDNSYNNFEAQYDDVEKSGYSDSPSINSAYAAATDTDSMDVSFMDEATVNEVESVAQVEVDKLQIENVSSAVASETAVDVYDIKPKEAIKTTPIVQAVEKSPLGEMVIKNSWGAYDHKLMRQAEYRDALALAVKDVSTVGLIAQTLIGAGTPINLVEQATVNDFGKIVGLDVNAMTSLTTDQYYKRIAEVINTTEPEQRDAWLTEMSEYVSGLGIEDVLDRPAAVAVFQNLVDYAYAGTEARNYYSGQFNIEHGLAYIDVIPLLGWGVKGVAKGISNTGKSLLALGKSREVLSSKDLAKQINYTDATGVEATITYKDALAKEKEVKQLENEVAELQSDVDVQTQLAGAEPIEPVDVAGDLITVKKEHSAKLEGIEIELDELEETIRQTKIAERQFADMEVGTRTVYDATDANGKVIKLPQDTIERVYATRKKLVNESANLEASIKAEVDELWEELKDINPTAADFKELGIPNVKTLSKTSKNALYKYAKRNAAEQLAEDIQVATAKIDPSAVNIKNIKTRQVAGTVDVDGVQMTQRQVAKQFKDRLSELGTQRSGHKATLLERKRKLRAEITAANRLIKKRQAAATRAYKAERSVYDPKAQVRADLVGQLATKQKLLDSARLEFDAVAPALKAHTETMRSTAGTLYNLSRGVNRSKFSEVARKAGSPDDFQKLAQSVGLDVDEILADASTQSWHTSPKDATSLSDMKATALTEAELSAENLIVNMEAASQSLTNIRGDYITGASRLSDDGATLTIRYGNNEEPWTYDLSQAFVGDYLLGKNARVVDANGRPASIEDVDTFVEWDLNANEFNVGRLASDTSAMKSTDTGVSRYLKAVDQKYGKEYVRSLFSTRSDNITEQTRIDAAIQPIKKLNAMEATAFSDLVLDAQKNKRFFSGVELVQKAAMEVGSKKSIEKVVKAFESWKYLARYNYDRDNLIFREKLFEAGYSSARIDDTVQPVKFWSSNRATLEKDIYRNDGSVRTELAKEPVNYFDSNNTGFAGTVYDLDTGEIVKLTKTKFEEYQASGAFFGKATEGKRIGDTFHRNVVTRKQENVLTLQDNPLNEISAYTTRVYEEKYYRVVKLLKGSKHSGLQYRTPDDMGFNTVDSDNTLTVSLASSRKKAEALAAEATANGDGVYVPMVTREMKSLRDGLEKYPSSQIGDFLHRRRQEDALMMDMESEAAVLSPIDSISRMAANIESRSRRNLTDASLARWKRTYADYIKPKSRGLDPRSLKRSDFTEEARKLGVDSEAVNWMKRIQLDSATYEIPPITVFQRMALWSMDNWFGTTTGKNVRMNTAKLLDKGLSPRAASWLSVNMWIIGRPLYQMLAGGVTALPLMVTRPVDTMASIPFVMAVLANKVKDGFSPKDLSSINKSLSRADGSDNLLAQAAEFQATDLYRPAQADELLSQTLRSQASFGNGVIRAVGAPAAATRDVLRKAITFPHIVFNALAYSVARRDMVRQVGRTNLTKKELQDVHARAHRLTQSQNNVNKLGFQEVRTGNALVDGTIQLTAQFAGTNAKMFTTMVLDPVYTASGAKTVKKMIENKSLDLRKVDLSSENLYANGYLRSAATVGAIGMVFGAQGFFGESGTQLGGQIADALGIDEIQMRRLVQAGGFNVAWNSVFGTDSDTSRLSTAGFVDMGSQFLMDLIGKGEAGTIFGASGGAIDLLATRIPNIYDVLTAKQVEVDDKAFVIGMQLLQTFAGGDDLIQAYHIGSMGEAFSKYSGKSQMPQDLFIARQESISRLFSLQPNIVKEYQRAKYERYEDSQLRKKLVNRYTDVFNSLVADKKEPKEIDEAILTFQHFISVVDEEMAHDVLRSVMEIKNMQGSWGEIIKEHVNGMDIEHAKEYLYTGKANAASEETRAIWQQFIESFQF